MVGNAIVNGFAVSAQTRPRGDVSRFLVQRALSVYTRAKAFGVGEAAELAKEARDLLKARIPDRRYVEFVKTCTNLDPRIAKEIAGRLGGRGDPFGLAASEKGVRTALRSDGVPALQSHHGALLEAFDAILTTVDIREGDLADVSQNVRWQAELFGSRKLSGLTARKRVITRSEEFVEAFAARKVTVDDYPKLMAGLLSGLRQAGKTLKSDELVQQVAAMRDARNAKTLQRRHWEYLDTLADLVTG